MLRLIRQMQIRLSFSLWWVAISASSCPNVYLGCPWPPSGPAHLSPTTTTLLFTLLRFTHNIVHPPALPGRAKVQDVSCPRKNLPFTDCAWGESPALLHRFPTQVEFVNLFESSAKVQNPPWGSHQRRP